VSSLALFRVVGRPIREEDDDQRDGLGFNTYARVLAGAALGTAGPFPIGVFGEWGTGKTSLLVSSKSSSSSILTY
jgi:predicted KAP-like P-loop ATPase